MISTDVVDPKEASEDGSIDNDVDASDGDDDIGLVEAGVGTGVFLCLVFSSGLRIQMACSL